ncbi:MAG TPA: PAS domain S-box protein [Syntrophales bacterium]|nr:PAS domain S-box protein [Syntrophales bacterium]
MSQKRSTKTDRRLSLSKIQDHQVMNNNTIKAKPAQHESREKEIIRQAFFDAVQESIVLIDSKGIITLLNAAAARRLGKTVKELEGAYIFDYFPPKIKKLRQEQVDKVLSTGKPVSFSDSHSGKFFEHRLYPVFCDDKTVSSVAVFTRDITERTRKKEEIRTAKDTYRNIFLNSQIGLYRTDMDTGLLLDANDAIARSMGYQDRASLMAKPFNFAERYADPCDGEKMLSLLQVDGEFHNYEARFRKKDNSIRWMRCSARLVREKGWIEGVLEDITDRKLAKEALRESELKYRMLVDQSLLGILILQDGRILYANNMVTEKGGYSRDELNAFSPIQVMELIHPDDREVVWNRMLSRLMGNREPERNECRLIAKDGSIYWVDVHTNVIEYLGKAAIQMCVVDITERKRAEEEMHKSEERYAALLDAFPDEILFTDLEGSIQKLSPSGLELFGYEQNILSNRNVLDYLVPEDRNRAAYNISLMHQGILTGPAEYRGIRADGSLVNIECNGNLIRRSNGQPTGMVIVIRDISKRKQLEYELKQHRENLEKLVKERTVELGRTVEELQFKNVILSTQQETSIDGILVVDDAANIVLFNRRFIEMWGLPANLVEERDDEPVLQFVTAKMADPQSFVRKVQYLYEHKQEISQDEIPLADGRVFDRYSAPMLGSDNRYYGRVWYFHDSTERKQAEEKLLQTLDSLRKAVGTTIQVMVSAVEVRDPYTAGHQFRSTDLACAIAIEMGLSQEKIEGIRMAGSIHDIGKLSIPAEILSKPTELTQIELLLIKEHSQRGYDILKDVESPWPLAEIIYQHHERLDGSGYPRNLKGDDILIEARIIAVADVVEAMASHRPYRPTLGIGAALEEIEKNRGILYDSEVVDVCLGLFNEKGYTLKEEKLFL